jgi:hypothetical protein
MHLGFEVFRVTFHRPTYPRWRTTSGGKIEQNRTFCKAFRMLGMHGFSPGTAEQPSNRYLPKKSHHVCLRWATTSPYSLRWVTMSIYDEQPRLPMLSHHVSLWWATIYPCAEPPYLPMLSHHVSLWWATMSPYGEPPCLPLMSSYVSL